MSYPKPLNAIAPNTALFENAPLVKSTGFREYDARWWFGHPGSKKEPELNLMGVQALGLGLGTLLKEQGVPREIVTGHDFRGYSAAIKYALIAGLLASGCKVHDIGMAMSPMAYFAQFHLDVPAVAMVTASHNDNGWTGVKMGSQRPVTFGPNEMSRLKEIVLSGKFDLDGGGSYIFHENFAEAYIRDLTNRPKITRKPQGHRRLRQRHGRRLRAAHPRGARLRGDPDGRRARLHLPPLQSEPRGHGDAPCHGPCGEGAWRGRGARLRRRRRPLRRGRQQRRRDLCRQDRRHARPRPDEGARPLAVRGRRQVDRALRDRPAAEGARAKTDYWKTGHSYIKRRVADLKALAGFEKSGHFFFNARPWAAATTTAS